MIEKLLKAGANANGRRPSETALMTAARTGNVEAARVLAHGASVDGARAGAARRR